ncbi:hypothetical protein B1J94_06425 [Leptospira kirschneri serovar Grippotyphosa]|nr:hypothetical protein B1J94_06425 [Leptospira kirschneri serovar Grippotyphosa]
MNSPSVSISRKRAIELVLLNATMEFFNNSIVYLCCPQSGLILLKLAHKLKPRIFQISCCGFIF